MDFKITGTYTDLYQLAMGQTYFLKNQADTPVTFDYYFRRIPYQNGYVVFAGLADMLGAVQDLHFSPEDIEYLSEMGMNKAYLKHLKNFKFKGKIYGPKEGEIIFPTEPILRVEGTVLETQLIETLLLNILNFQSLIATKAARIRSIAPHAILSEFGLRRAQGMGGIWASRATVVGGFDSTSNVYAAQKYGMKAVGTMAHSFIQMQEDEITAFRNFADTHPDNCILLVDTYSTLKSGVPNAIKVAKEMEKKGKRLAAIRLDSGDLSYFARKSRNLLDKAGLQYVKIAASNQIDEFVVRSLKQQNAPIDIYGIGTNLVVGEPDAALDGIYKLVTADGKPRIKVSENLKKTTLPGKKQVYRLVDSQGCFSGADAIAQLEEGFPDKMTSPLDAHKSMTFTGAQYEPLLHLLMENGIPTTLEKDLEKIKAYAQKRLAQLPAEYKRFENPHIYKVGISPVTKSIRDDLRKRYTHQ